VGAHEVGELVGQIEVHSIGPDQVDGDPEGGPDLGHDALHQLRRVLSGLQLSHASKKAAPGVIRLGTGGGDDGVILRLPFDRVTRPRI
jgi:hypothetical protein